MWTSDVPGTASLPHRNREAFGCCVVAAGESLPWLCQVTVAVPVKVEHIIMGKLGLGLVKHGPDTEAHLRVKDEQGVEWLGIVPRLFEQAALDFGVVHLYKRGPSRTRRGCRGQH